MKRIGQIFMVGKAKSWKMILPSGHTGHGQPKKYGQRQSTKEEEHDCYAR